jgi:putative membrane protein
MNPHGPFDGRHGPGGLEESSLSMLPYFGSFLLLLLLLLAIAALYLWHQGKLPLPKLGSHRSPEDEAKRILAERFARGDMTSDEFLERSSILNWTPGSDPLPSKPRKNRRI